MAVFEYTIKDKAGKISRGTVEEASADKVRELLHNQGCLIVSIKPRKGAAAGKSFSFGGGVKPDEVVLFSRQLTTLIESGIPLVQAMEILNEQTKNPGLKKILDTVSSDIREGSAFNAALGKHRKAFNDFYVSMVKAGETSGKLADILNRVSSYMEETLALQRKIKASMMYPTVVVSMAMLITAFLIIKVVPTFKGIFDSMGGTLPVPTQILLGISDFARANFLLIVVIIAGLVFGLKYVISTPAGRRKFDKMLLTMPVFGPLFSKVAVAKFCRTFSTLVTSGVPILSALDIVGSTSGNKVIEEAVVSAKKFVQEGESISAPLDRSKAFPPMVIRMISVGEKTGKLQEMLSKIAVFYEAEVNTAVEGLTSMIEPLIIGFLGIVIGGIVIALFLPILQITQMMH